MTSESESSTQKTAIWRRQLIVDKPFQYRLIGMLLAIWAANSIFFSIILYYFYQGHILRFYNLIPREGLAPLLSAPTLFGIAVGFIFVFGLVMVGIIGMYMSNQIAGPLYRVKLCLNRISEGDVNFEIRFRARDFLTDFPGYFNNMMRGLKDQAGRDIEALKAVEEQLEDTDKARSLVAELRAKKEHQFGFAEETTKTSTDPGHLSQAVH
jgi:methyl-accepting chemotaxis protein